MNTRRRKQMEADGRFKQGERTQDENQRHHWNKASKGAIHGNKEG